MTDSGWAAGIAKLLVAFPDRDQSAGVLQARGQVYREHLEDLSDEAWFWAVSEAVKGERWFPTVAALRDYAESYTPAGYKLLPPARTEEQREADRAEARRGVEMIREALKRLPPAPVGLRPAEKREPALVHASDERLDELRRQAEEIMAGEEAKS